MVREMVTIQVGQCGNQLGRLFWQQALAEHSVYNQDGVYDDAMSSFFRNVDARGSPAMHHEQQQQGAFSSSNHGGPLQELPLGDGTGAISSLKARAVLVDTEGGVVQETMRGPLGELFEESHTVTDVSGAGNNWAHGHLEYGPRHAEAVREAVRKATEYADSLQCFFLLHSLGGGTGSGLGTYILGQLAEDFPTCLRFTASVFPSEDDDVITSPYNAALAFTELVEHADVVFPMDNSQLADIAQRCAQARERSNNSGKLGSNSGGGGSGMDWNAQPPSSSSSSSSSVPLQGRQWLRSTPKFASPLLQRSSSSSRKSNDRSSSGSSSSSYRGGKGSGGGGGGNGVGRSEDYISANPLFPDLPSSSSSSSSAAAAGRPHSGHRNSAASSSSSAAGKSGSSKRSEGFDAMNRVGSRLLTHLTASMRFPGQLNTDMNEITTNLVPYPRLHFLLPALAPLDPQPLVNSGNNMSRQRGSASSLPRASVVRALFNDGLSSSHQLVNADLRQGGGAFLANAMLLRGDLSVSDVNTVMAKLQPSLNMVHFNSDGFKVGLCGSPPLEHPHALLNLANHTSVAGLFERMQERFQLLYARKAMVHHYAGYMGVDETGGDGSGLFAAANEALMDVSSTYRELETAKPPSKEELARLVPFC